MEQRDQEFWSRIISPALRKQVMPDIAVTIGISGPFVDDIPLEDCGDFVWALVCLSRWAPDEILAQYKAMGEKPSPTKKQALLKGSIEAKTFFDFPLNSLKNLVARLKRNVDASEVDSPQQKAHERALDRIEDIIVFLAESHPSAWDWVREQHSGYTNKKQRRANHLRLV